MRFSAPQLVLVLGLPVVGHHVIVGLCVWVILGDGLASLTHGLPGLLSIASSVSSSVLLLEDTGHGWGEGGREGKGR